MLLRRGAEGVHPWGAGADVPDASGQILGMEDAAVEATGVRAGAGGPAVERGGGSRAAWGACRVFGEGGEGRVRGGFGADDEQGEGADKRGEVWWGVQDGVHIYEGEVWGGEDEDGDGEGLCWGLASCIWTQPCSFERGICFDSSSVLCLGLWIIAVEKR